MRARYNKYVDEKTIYDDLKRDLEEIFNIKTVSIKLTI